MNKRTRHFHVPPQDQRCKAVIKIKDGTTADCMRRATCGGYCWQHKNIAGVGLRVGRGRAG